ncbi:MAG: hypothetical protein VX737_00405 [Pseudomonadota bacterium]|nr:hypothetical protein [Pseudomonadota bacterium]
MVYGNLEIVQMLINEVTSRDINIKGWLKDGVYDGMNLLEMAIRENHIKIFNSILEARIFSLESVMKTIVLSSSENSGYFLSEVLKQEGGLSTKKIQGLENKTPMLVLIDRLEENGQNEVVQGLLDQIIDQIVKSDSVLGLEEGGSNALQVLLQKADQCAGQSQYSFDEFEWIFEEPEKNELHKNSIKKCLERFNKKQLMEYDSHGRTTLLYLVGKNIGKYMNSSKEFQALVDKLELKK